MICQPQNAVAVAATDRGLEWRVDDQPVDYPQALAFMEARADAIRKEGAPECVWLLEHPPLYTSGTSTKPADLLNARFPVHVAGRGGEYTYHGPGQRICYTMLDLKLRGQDVRCFVHRLEEWIIRTLAMFNVTGERREGRPGVWVRRTDINAPQREDKIAALGVRVRRWVTLHGISINLEPDLDHYNGIVPCGISEHGVTSLAELGITATMTDLDMALREAFTMVFCDDRKTDCN